MNKNLEVFYKARRERANILLFDLEANFYGPEDARVFETIQIGYVKFDAQYAILQKGSIFIKPQNAYVLTEFIKDLTGISQDEVNAGVSFPQGLKMFTDLYNPESEYLMSYGNYDMKQLYRDCQVHNIDFPFPKSERWKYPRHTNIKNAIAKKLDMREKGMEKLMQQLDIPLVWKHHNGEDDCVNILSCVKKVFSDI